MSTTPRVDAAPCTRADIICKDGHRREKYVVEIDFARELEREIANLNRLLFRREQRIHELERKLQ